MRIRERLLDIDKQLGLAETALSRVARAGEHFADFIEHAGVGSRIAARRAADWRLVDLDYFVDLASAAQAFERTRLSRRTA